MRVLVTGGAGFIGSHIVTALRDRGHDPVVLDALRDKPHSTHFTVAEALAAIDRIGPRRAFLTHMSHDLGHAGTNARLPRGVELAYDGLVLDVDVDVQ